LVHFFASDAHDVKRRPPVLSRCYRKVAKAKGEEVADLLLQKNPEAVINGRPLPPQPDWSEGRSEGGKRRWFSFLTGR
jgi:tyrosine-protein phosphatase YwqE